MFIEKEHFGIIPENESAYFNLLQAAIESVDELSSLTITKNPSNYHFRLSPSHPMYLDSLIDTIIKMNTLFKIHVDFSKSMKNTCIISFNIPVFP